MKLLFLIILSSTQVYGMDCTPKVNQKNLFLELGYTDSQQNIPCVEGDFDSNGSNDYIVYKCDDASVICKGKAVLMNKGNVLKAFLIPRLPGTELFKASIKSPEYLKDFGCKLPLKDSLVEVGDGDGRYNKIYTLEKDQFVLFSSCQTVETL